MKKVLVLMAIVMAASCASNTPKWTQAEQEGGWFLITQKGGPSLGVSDLSRIITDKGFAFKDLNRDGSLQPYEDWRLPVEKRAADLASRLSKEDIAGLMLYSIHQYADWDNPVLAMSGITPLPEIRTEPWQITADQKVFLEQGVRHVLLAGRKDNETAARWNNELQRFSEGVGFGIPANTSADPLHAASGLVEYVEGQQGRNSLWPDQLGLAAMFDPAAVEEFGRIASEEYRALGIATALSPQIDMASDPRWNRFNGTFGESSKLAAAIARAYCDGFQTTPDSKTGWGALSVNTMVKHWPGGGSGEGGRDAHFAYGKYAVYPGGNFDEHLIPFINGAFKLSGKTGIASAVMPYYTISYGQDKENGLNVGNAYSHYIITKLLREKYGYDGVVCTDWLVVNDNDAPIDSFFAGKRWGLETTDLVTLHYKALEAGVDMFGGNSDPKPVVAAYEMGVAEHGEAYMKARFEQSGKRLLRNIFNAGLFENPYLDIAKSAKTVGKPEFMKAGWEAQKKSIVLLKNRAVSGKPALPLAEKTKVYIPQRHIDEGFNYFGFPTPAADVAMIEKAVGSKYFTLVDTAAEADAAIVFIESPASIAYDKNRGGYLPVTLQYGPYTADQAREAAVAQGADENRSYKGKTNTASNKNDLDLVLATREAMGGKPVIVAINTNNPPILSEFESAADAILVYFGVQTQAVLEIASGRQEPSALLPFRMPSDMNSVEISSEDKPFDYPAYKDSEGNTYDFAFGLNWKGVIADKRVGAYK